MLIDIFTSIKATYTANLKVSQGDQEIGKKFAQILEKVAKTVAKPKM